MGSVRLQTNTVRRGRLINFEAVYSTPPTNRSATCVSRPSPQTTTWHLYARDTTRTDAEGAFLIETAGFPTSSFELIIEDTDGEANGGQFNNMSTLIQIDDSEYQEGDGRWYEGKVTRELEIHMEKQE